MLVSFIQEQMGPLMDKVNQLLELDRRETEQFLHYRSGHFGEDNKILAYFEANQSTRKYSAPEEAPAAAPAATATVAVSGGTWLKASPTGSIALLGLPETLTITADATGLAPSITPYKGTVVLSSTNASMGRLNDGNH